MSEQNYVNIDRKLDLILANQEEIIETQEAIAERQEQLAESIANLSLPGSGYSIDQIDEL